MNDAAGNDPNRVSRETLESLGYALYEGPVPFDEIEIPEPPNADDYDWALNSRELHRLYQRMTVAVRDRKVWGVGKGWAAAWEDARTKPGCPEIDDLAFVELWGMPGDPEENEEGTTNP